MIRLFATLVVSLLSSVVALLVTAVVLDDMSLEPVGLVVAAVIFTVVMVLTTPLLRQIAVTKAPALLGSTALVATLISLVIASLVSDDLTIKGAKTWVAATVMVWILVLLGRFLLPFIIFRDALRRRRDERR